MRRRETFLRVTWVIEAGAVAWFFVQAVRYLFGALYAHVSSADIVLRLGDPGLAVPGVVPPVVAQAEVIAVVVAMLTPLLVFLLATRRIAFAISATVVAVGRVFMAVDAAFIQVLGAAIVVAGAAWYLAAVARQQPARFAVMLTIGFTVDQAVRALGHTFDPTLPDAFLTEQAAQAMLTFVTALALALFALAVLRAAMGSPRAAGATPAYSGVTIWGGLALGALLYLQCALLALPNAVAWWSGMDYSIIAPWLAAATALPLAPAVREVARRTLTIFDAQWRGWLWLLVLALLIVIGNRFNGAGAAAALVVAQFWAVLSFWWVVSPVSKEQRDVTGPALVVGFLVVVILGVADFFTYEYAFVRDFAGLGWLSNLLRAMRGLGVAVMLVAAALSAVPLMNTRRRIPWQHGPMGETVVALMAVFAGAVIVAVAALSPNVTLRGNAERMRVASYNIHGGYSLYFDYSLPNMAETIRVSGADVVLLQEVDAGRLMSFGVDQALWLGRRLGMQVRYLPTNESLQGLAVLSRFPVTLDDGRLLTSQGLQTGVQRVQVRPDEGVVDFYNTWLSLLFAREQGQLSLQEQDQWQQLQQVLAVISADHPGGVVGRVVLGGTFNNTPDSDVHALLEQVGFNDPFDGMPLDRAATLRRGEAAVARFDYLWLRNILPTGRDVLEQDASDHRLAVVELNLAP